MPMRILRIGITFVALIVANSYTANLAAFLSAPAFQIHGPTTLAELRKATVCVAGFGADDVAPWVDAVYEKPASAPICTCHRENSTVVVIGTCSTDPDEICETNAWAELSYCHRLLTAGTVSAIVGWEDLINQYARDKCSEVAISSYRFGAVRLAVNLIRSLFQLPELANDEWAAAAQTNLSVSINNFLKSPIAQELQARHFGDPACTKSVSNTSTLEFQQLRGLFLLLGIFCAIALLVAVIGRAYRERSAVALGEPSTKEMDQLAMMTDGEMLRKVYELAMKQAAEGKQGDEDNRVAETSTRVVPAYEVKVQLQETEATSTAGASPVADKARTARGVEFEWR